MLWWRENLATGIKMIDDQHKGIFEKTEKVLSLDSSSDKKAVNDTFIFLMNYCVNHFSEEEQAMLEYGYKDFKHHREQHNYFIEELYKIHTDIKTNGINEDALDSLKVLVIDWLANHISEEDKKFADSIN